MCVDNVLNKSKYNITFKKRSMNQKDLFCFKRRKLVESEISKSLTSRDRRRCFQHITKENSLRKENIFFPNYAMSLTMFCTFQCIFPTT